MTHEDEMAALRRRVSELEEGQRKLIEMVQRLASEIDPEKAARRALELLRSDPVVQTQDYHARMASRRGR